jgi:hypothetical protein
MNAHPLNGPALAELFMQVMFAPGVLTRSEREMVAAVAAADCWSTKEEERRDVGYSWPAPRRRRVYE